MNTWFMIIFALLLVGCDTSTQFEQIKIKAEKGDAKAQSNLGNCYRKGEGVPKDAAEAVKWFRKAAEQNCAEAQCNLGDCYFSGKGVAKDEVEAVRWYSKAAGQGNAYGQSRLAACYREGDGLIHFPMVGSVSSLSWLWMVSGFALGIGGFFGAILYLGRKAAKRMRLEDRGDWDRPLPHRFPLNQVVAVYRRRKKYQHHDRHYHQHRHSRTHNLG